MIVGLGVDIIEINRISETYSKFGETFLKKILTVNEVATFYNYNKKIEFLAGRFAAKESVIKSYYNFKKKILYFTQIEIMNDKNGLPIINILSEKIHEKLLVSISHSKENAIAFTIIEQI